LFGHGIVFITERSVLPKDRIYDDNSNLAPDLPPITRPWPHLISAGGREPYYDQFQRENPMWRGHIGGDPERFVYDSRRLELNFCLNYCTEWLQHTTPQQSRS